MGKKIVKIDSVDFICFGGEDWWYHNRGHIDMQLMRRFARLGTAVYVNSLIMQKPNLSEGRKFLQKVFRKAQSIFSGLKETDAGFWAYSPFSLPVHHIKFLAVFNQFALRTQLAFVRRRLSMNNPVVWVACPVACETALKIPKQKLVYQRTDKYEEYPGVDYNVVSEFDLKLKKAADLTVFVNKSLFEAESSQCRDAIYLDHGVDYQMFSSAHEDKYVPDELKGLQRPIVGFYGGFGEHTTDVRLLADVAALLPDVVFVLVGQPSHECDVFAGMKNVKMFGKKPYQQIPHYGKCFDVALMPWKQNRWIQACNPIKLKEYLALGKPVVSTYFNELEGYMDLVYCAGTAGEFAGMIKKALEEDCPAKAAVRREKVKAQTWDNKARIVLEKLLGRSTL